MTRLKDFDDLGDKAGALGRAFGKMLEAAYVASSPRAASLLQKFHDAAAQLPGQAKTSVNAFNATARRVQRLKGMPLKKHFDAIRAYMNAKLALRAENPKFAEPVIHYLNRQQVKAAAPAQPRVATARQKFNIQ